MARRPLNDKEKEILERIGSSKSVQRSRAIVDMYESGDEKEIAAYEQSNADRNFRQRASRLTMQQFEKEFAEIDRQKQQLESEKGSFWDALKPGGQKPSEWWDNRKEKNAEIKALESKAGKYRAVYDEKKSREMTDNLPEDVKRLLDEYNNTAYEKEGVDWAGVAAGFSGMAGSGTNAVQRSSAELRRDNIRKQLTDRGYDNFEDLAEYRKYITDKEAADEQTERWSKVAEEHPVLASVGARAITIPAAVSGLYGTVKQSESDVDFVGGTPYSPYHTPMRAKEAIDTTISENFEDGILSAKAKSFLYGALTSAADSTIASISSGSLGLGKVTAGEALLGLSAANDVIVRGPEKGMTKEQTMKTAGVAMAAEILFEHFSLGKLGAFTSKGVKTALGITKDFVLNSFVNATEEIATEVTNIAYDFVKNGGLSDYYQNYERYLALGNSEKDAKKYALSDTTLQILEAGASGLLIGGVFSGVDTVSSQLNYNSQLKDTGRQIIEYDNAESLLAGAKDVQDNDKLRALEEEIVLNEQAQKRAELEGKIAEAKSAVSDAEAFRTEKRTEYKRATGQAAVDAAKAYKASAKDVKAKKAELRSLQKEDSKIYSKKDYKNVGRLSEMLAEQTDADTDALVKKAVSERLEKVGESNAVVADAIVKKAKGEKLTKKEQNAYNNSKKALQVYREFVGDTYDAEWARNLNKKVSELIDRRYNPTLPRSAEPTAPTEKATKEAAAPKSEEYEQKVEDYKGQLKEALHRDGQDKEVLDAAVDLCFGYGRNGGYTLQEAIGSEHISDRITPEQRQHAYEAGVYQGVKDTANVRYKGDAVNVFIEGFRGKDNNSRRSYTSAFDIFYSEGVHTTKSFDAVMKENASLLRFIDRSVAEKAFNVGRKQADNAEPSAPSRKKPTTKGEYNSKTVEEKEVDVFFESLAKKLGVNITRVQSLTSGDRRANAYIDLGKGEIVSSASSDNEYQSSVHEIGHIGYAADPEGMRKVAAAVKDYYINMHSAAKLQQVLRKYSEIYGMDLAECEEEFVCDALAGIFSTDEGVNEFLAWLENESGYSAQEKKTVLEKLSEWILEIIDAINELIQGGSLNDVVADFAKEETDRLKDIRKMFLEVLDGVVDGSAEGETKNTAEGGVKMSYAGADSKYITAVESGDIETAQKMVDEAAKSNGYDSPMLYHGTHSFGFTNFDLDKMDDKRSIFLTSNEKIASTYSGVTGTKKIGESNVVNIANMSAEEIVETLNEYDAKYKAGTTEGPHNYELYDYGKTNKLINSVNDGIDKLKITVDSEIKSYAEKMAVDFDDKDAKIHRQLVSLSERLDKYDYQNLSTPIYLLLHHTDVFKGSAEIAELEKNIRVMNQVRSKDLSSGVVVDEALGGYVIEVMDVDRAREYLENRFKSGNYSLYAKLGNSFVIDGKGALWNDIRHWSSKLDVKPADVSVVKKGDFYELVDNKTNEIVDGGSIAVNSYSDELANTNKDRLRVMMVNTANSILHINTENMYTTREIAKFAKERGYDSVVFKDIRDNGGWNSEVGYDELADIYVIFDVNSVKSADAVTYDDKGDIIPLSERFKDDNSDIRFSYQQGKPNKSLTNKDKKRYNKKTTYDEFTSNAMQWAYNDGTKIGDTKYLFNPNTDKHCIIEATKDSKGFIIIEELPPNKWREKYGRDNEVEKEGRSLHWNINQYESTKKRESDNSNSARHRGEDGRNVQFSQEDRFQGDESGNLERGGKNNQGTQNKVKPSLDWVDFAEEKARERSLASEVTELKKMVEELRGKIQHPGVKHVVNKLAVQKVAKSLKSGYMSKINLQVLTDELFTFYGYMANENGLSWDNVQIYLESIATKILDESKFKNPDVSEYAKSILRDIKGVKIKLNEKQKNAVAEKYGSYNEFRKRMMGTLVLSEEGTSLDERWQELADDYPYLFDIETSDVNQPLELVEIVSALRQTYEDSYGMDYDSAKDMLMAEIYEQYFEVPETKYISEEYAVKLARAKADYNEKVRELKAEFKRQKDEAYKKARAEYAESLKGIRAEQQEEILKARVRYELRARNMADTRIKEKKRANIIRQVKRLDRLLRNPKKGAPSAGTNKYGQDYVHLTNIPETLKKTVIDFCSVFIEHDAGVFSGVTKRDNISQREKRIEALMREYAVLKKSDSYLSESVVPEMEDKLDALAQIMAERRLSQLSIEELDTVIEIADHLITVINNQVEVWVEGKKFKVEEKGKEAIADFVKKGQHKYVALPGHDFAEKWGVDNLKPIYFFERVGGVLEKLFLAIQNDGQRAYARNVNAAAAFMDGISKKYNYQKWEKEKELTLKTTQGDTIKLTKAQAMHIWATAKREVIAGKDSRHIMQGGIVFKDEIDADVVKEKNGNTFDKKKLTSKVWKYKKTDGGAHRISLSDLDKISEYLTDEQKKFVDEMVGYLSNDMAALGNEISMELYGIRRFTEKYYIPFNSAKNFIYRSMGEQGEAMLRSESFTKETTWGANNPLVVDDFVEVIVGHIERMSMYNSMVIPLENFNRVWNYKTFAPEEDGTESAESVRSAMETAMGKSYTAYVDTLLKDINGGINADSREKSIGKLLSNFKKTAVLGSASVVIQQPSAVVRAFAEIDPKYFVTTTFAGRKKAWENALKYSSTALLKDIGGFDTVSGQGTVDWLTKTEYKGKDKVLKLFTDSQYRDDVLAWGPGFADKVTWAHIWLACEKEVKANNKSLSGEAFDKEVGKRFDEVINKTQVYDSVLSRSANMRSKSNTMQTVTAFMSEPTVQANMYASAVHDIRSGNKGKGARKVAAVVASQLFNAALVSIIYAARDDEEDETLAEKYISEVVNNFLGSLNPLSLIPLYKDIVSILQGFDVKRTDMNVISKFVDAVQKVFSKNTKLSKWDRAKGVIGAVGDIWGIPVTNFIRDSEAVYNVAKDVKGIKDTTGKGIAYAISDDFAPEFQKLNWYEPSTKDERLYYAFRDNDEKMYNRLAEQYKTGGEIKSALREQIEEGYIKERLTEDEAMAQFRRLGFSENEAYYEVRKLKEPVAEDESEDANAAFKSFNDMQGIQSEADAELEAERKEAEEDGKEFSEKADYTWLRDKLKAGDKDAIKEEINLLKDKGVSESKIAGEVRTWLKENDSDVKKQAEQSLKGNYSSYESKVKRIADKYGVDESAVASAIRGAAGSNSDPVEGTVYALGDLHFAIDKGNEQTVRSISSKIYDAKLKIKLAEGEDYDKAYKSVRTGIRSSLSSKWKDEYVAGNSTVRAQIRRQLWATGMYDSLTALDETLYKWREGK